MDTAHRAEQFGRTCGITNAPTCHGVIFAHSAQMNRPLRHAGQSGKHHVLVIIIYQAIVDFVRDDDQVVLLRNLRDG